MSGFKKVKTLNFWYGFKNEIIKDLIVSKKNILNYDQNEILENENNFYETLTSKSLFDDEKKAEHFGKTSMKRGFEHKVLEYNSENYDRFWNEQKR